MKIRFIVTFAVVFSAIGVVFSSNFQTTESAGLVSIDSKCRIASFQTAFQESEAVFVGKVVSEKKDGDIKTFDFKVEKYWKGKKAKNIKIDVYETSRYQAFFKEGEKYLIYASASDDGKFSVGRCSRSRDAGDAEEDLKQLGKGKIPR